MPHSQNYCLVHFVDSVDEGYQFDMSEWPLDVTVADVGTIDASIEQET